MKLDFSKIGVLNGSAVSTTILIHRDQMSEFLAACEDEDIIWSSCVKPMEFNPAAHEHPKREWYAICFWAAGIDVNAKVHMTYAAYDYEPAVFSHNWLSINDIILPEEKYENLTFEEWML